MRRLMLSLAIAAATAVAPSVARAEVSDKIPSIPSLWLGPLAYGGLALLLTRFRWWLCFALIPLTLILAGASFSELIRDPDIGPAILREQGVPYVASVYGSVALLIAMQAVAVWVGLRARSRSSARAAV